jgi:hypothetical protein
VTLVQGKIETSPDADADLAEANFINSPAGRPRQERRCSRAELRRPPRLLIGDTTGVNRSLVEMVPGLAPLPSRNRGMGRDHCALARLFRPRAGDALD